MALESRNTHAGAESLLTGQKRALELAVHGAPLSSVLEALARALEVHLKQSLFVSILLVDRDGTHLRHGAAPSLPLGYRDVIDGLEIGEGIGSCGTAAFRREPVIVTDIQSDPLWKEFRTVAAAHGLAACWSAPILSSGGVVLGTFAIYYPSSKHPSLEERDAVELLTHTAAIVIERDRAHEELKASAERYRLVSEAARDAIWDWDLMTNEVVWSPGAQKDFSYLPGTPGTWWRERVHPDDRERVESSLARVRSQDADRWEEEYRFRLSDGTYAVVVDRAQILRDETGRAVRMVGAMLNRTERRRIQERDRFLVKLDDHLRALAEPDDITFTAATLLGQHLLANRCAYATVEDDEDTFQLTGNYTNGVRSIVGRYTFRQFGDECLRLMRAGAPYVVSDSEQDTRVTEQARPAYRAAEIGAVICVPILKHGRFVAAMAVHTATARLWHPTEVQLVQQVASRSWESIERARLTRTLRSSLEREQRAREDAELQKRLLHSLFMQAPTLIAILRGPEHIVELANASICDAWARRVDDLRNRPLFDVLPELRTQVFKQLLADVLRTGEPHVGTETPAVFQRPDGSAETVYFNFVYSPYRNVDGVIEGVFVVASDVTAQIRARQEIEGLKEAAEAANRAKDEFLAMLGHELRNPLSPIVTALQLMKLKDAGSERERAVIERQVTHVTRLVDDLLDVSRIAKGKVDLKQVVVELGEVVGKAIELTAPLIEDRCHRLTVDVPHGLGVYADPTRLTQVISNLLTNAAKYTEPGGEIAVSAGNDAHGIVLRVRDTGYGIRAEMLPHVFNLFVQERQSIDRARGGLGLGLTIVRSLVERHGGSVSATSDGPGKGSEFIVRLPAVDRPTPDAGSAPAALSERLTHGGGRKILIVDDNDDGAEMLSAALTLMGYRTEVVHDGPAAIAAARRFEPDIALLDIGLPVLDGYELAERLRELPGLSSLRLIALTGYGLESDRARSRQAGFHGHLVKPVNFHALESMLAG